MVSVYYEATPVFFTAASWFKKYAAKSRNFPTDAANIPQMKLWVLAISK